MTGPVKKSPDVFADVVAKAREDHDKSWAKAKQMQEEVSGKLFGTVYKSLAISDSKDAVVHHDGTVSVPFDAIVKEVARFRGDIKSIKDPDEQKMAVLKMFHESFVNTLIGGRIHAAVVYGPGENDLNFVSLERFEQMKGDGTIKYKPPSNNDLGGRYVLDDQKVDEFLRVTGDAKLEKPSHSPGAARMLGDVKSFHDRIKAQKKDEQGE